MIEPDPTPDPQKSALDVAAWRETIRDVALAIIAICGIATGVMSYLHGDKIDKTLQDVNSNKDISAKTAEVQQKVVAVEVRGTPQDVAALKATTQETK